MGAGRKGRHSVFGIFKDQISLNHAVDMLRSQNFRNSDISVLMQTKEKTRDLAFKQNTKAPEGATMGAIAGVLAGGTLGWLVGSGALSIPNLGAFVAAGPIMSTIAGAGAGGTIGGITGGLIGLGIPEYEASRFEGFVKDGGILISVHVDDEKWESKAKEILYENGAKNIATTTERRTDEPNYYKNRIDQDYEDKHP